MKPYKARSNSNLSLASRASGRASFTLIELVVVLGILAILATVTVIVIRPDQLFKQARDSQRLSDLQSINTALSLFQAAGGTSMGTANVVYISLPATDGDTDCDEYSSLPDLPAGYSYHCAPEGTYRDIDGTGWLPLDFASFASLVGSMFATLPIDPSNTTTGNLFLSYIPGGSWHLATALESEKYKMGGSSDSTSDDGGSFPELYEIGNDMTLLPVDYGESSLVGYWNFEEGGSSATTYDASGNNNTGTWAGSGTHYAGAKVGNYSGQFNGTNDKISVATGESLRLVNAITIIAWVNPGNFSQTGAYQHILMKTGDTPYNWYLRHANGSSNLNLTLKIPTEQTMSSVSLTQDIWQFVAYTYDNNVSSNNSKSYLNGALQSTASKSGAISEVGSNTLGIGAYAAGGEYWYGYIDDLRIYSRALTAAEILALYNATK
ncbi:MAG: prepilin-type N-terminal cleavage/methylation domain-containing protein [Candidatus Pacebacteria bacterium]|nr:prepilin-type N-terminal cleavage/methylation domain-containing protein [Candidatus Paceibacterota bacterium]